jgi:hypothetical protein
MFAEKGQQRLLLRQNFVIFANAGLIGSRRKVFSLRFPCGRSLFVASYFQDVKFRCKFQP